MRSLWPWDKRPSTSSNTKNRTWLSDKRPDEIRSSRRPGVETQMSTPFSRASICSLIGIPPAMSSSLMFGSVKCFLNNWTCLYVCSASSFDGSMMRASGELFSRLIRLNREPVWLLGEMTVFSRGAFMIAMLLSFYKFCLIF